MLNATMCAVTRVICVLLEMNQTETGGGVDCLVWMLKARSQPAFVSVLPA